MKLRKIIHHLRTRGFFGGVPKYRFKLERRNSPVLFSVAADYFRLSPYNITFYLRNGRAVGDLFRCKEFMKGLILTRQNIPKWDIYTDTGELDFNYGFDNVELLRF